MKVGWKLSQTTCIYSHFNIQKESNQLNIYQNTQASNTRIYERCLKTGSKYLHKFSSKHFPQKKLANTRIYESLVKNAPNNLHIFSAQHQRNKSFRTLRAPPKNSLHQTSSSFWPWLALVSHELLPRAQGCPRPRFAVVPQIHHLSLEMKNHFFLSQHAHACEPMQVCSYSGIAQSVH